MSLKNLVYTDNRQRDFQLKSINGHEIYKIQYRFEYRWSDEIRYQVYRAGSFTGSADTVLKYFDTLKEARAYARAH